MGEPVIVPTPEQIVARMQDCRRELAALRRLYRVAVAAREANDARARRQSLPTPCPEAAHA